MLIHVHQGKGSRDRDLPLTPKLLEALREYWRWCKNKPRTYLFPSRVEPIQPERPLSGKVVWNACHEAALRAGLTKTAHVAPQLRNSSARSGRGSPHDSAIARASTASAYPLWRRSLSMPRRAVRHASLYVRSYVGADTRARRSMPFHPSILPTAHPTSFNQPNNSGLIPPLIRALWISAAFKNP